MDILNQFVKIMTWFKQTETLSVMPCENNDKLWIGTLRNATTSIAHDLKGDFQLKQKLPSFSFNAALHHF